MARVAVPSTAFSRAPTGKVSRPVKDGGYLAFIHGLPCVVSGRTPVEAAHISYADPRYGKLGRGKSQKESDRWCLPLSREEHARQHRIGERAYWACVGIDPCVVALALYGAYPNVELARLVIANIERKVRESI